jgi:hypothetical protein
VREQRVAQFLNERRRPSECPGASGLTLSGGSMNDIPLINADARSSNDIREIIRRLNAALGATLVSTLAGSKDARPRKNGPRWEGPEPRAAHDDWFTYSKHIELFSCNSIRINDKIRVVPLRANNRSVGAHTC